jgi:hypothetical protein
MSNFAYRHFEKIIVGLIVFVIAAYIAGWYELSNEADQCQRNGGQLVRTYKTHDYVCANVIKESTP